MFCTSAVYAERIAEVSEPNEGTPILFDESI
jgi:hypothetical protein